MRTTHLLVTTVIATGLIAVAFAETPKPNDAIVGAWTLNKASSDLGATQGDGEGRSGDDGRRGDGSGGRRGGGGGFGGGFGRGGGGGFGGQQQTPEQREAAQ